MRHGSLNLAAVSMIAVASWAAAATAQAPAPAAQPAAGAPSGIVVAAPTYTSILMEIGRAHV